MRDPGGPIAAIISWIVIVVVVGALAALVAFPPADEPLDDQAEELVVADDGEPDDAPPSPILSWSAKFAIYTLDQLEQQSEQAGSERARDRLEEEEEAVRDETVRALGMTVSSDWDRMRSGILIAEMRGLEAGLETLEPLTERADQRIADEAALLQRALTNSGSLSDDERAHLIETHDFFGRLALAFDDEPGSEARVSIVEESRGAYFLSVGFGFAIVALLVLGFVLVVVAIVLIATGRIKRAYHPPAPGGSVFLEAFAVFLVLFIFTMIVTPILELVIGPSADLLRWVCLAAPFWPVLRGAPMANVKAAIGWHKGKGFVREVLAGVFGYIALLPIMGLGIAITLYLTYTYGSPEGDGAPTHPLPQLLAEAGPLKLVLLVTLATLWAPIVEETCFRGALYHHLRGRLHFLLAGTVVAFIFAAMHPQGLFGIPVLMSIAINFALLREWRGSIIAPVVAHALNNGMVTTLLLLLFAIG